MSDYRLQDLASDASEYIDNGNFEPEDLAPVRALLDHILNTTAAVEPTREERREAIRLAIGQGYGSRAAAIQAASEIAAFIANGTQPEKDPQK